VPVEHGIQVNAGNTGVLPGSNLRVEPQTIVVTEDWIRHSNGGSRTLANREFPPGTGVVVEVSNVTIRNSRFVGEGGANASYSAGHAVLVAPGVTNVEIQDVEFDGQHRNGGDRAAVGGAGYRLRRVHVHGWPYGMHNGNGDVVVQESYMHDLTNVSPTHQENAWIPGGAHQVWQRNNLYSDGAGDISASLAIYNYWDDAPLNDILIEANYFNSSGGTALYAGGLDPANHPHMAGPLATGIRVVGNIFGRELNRYSGAYAPAFGFPSLLPGNEWRDNRWGDRGPYWQPGDPEPGDVVPDPGLF
jgi:hypothetical protein